MAARDPADEVFRFRLNGASVTVMGPGARPLGPMLREERGLTGVKLACDDGSCGLCSVLVDGDAVRSCSYPLAQAQDRVVVTVEGLHAHATLNRIQRAFLKWGVPQCGFCAPAMLVAATELIGTRARPSVAEIRTALSGVVCRCTGYGRIVAAVAEAVGEVEMPLPPAPGGAIGHDVPAIDGFAKVTGGSRFAGDVVPDDALWLRLVPALRGPARIAHEPFAPFLARHPGLLRVFTASDLPAALQARTPLLAEDHVAFPGEPVCTIVGSREALAALPQNALPIHYEPMAGPPRDASDAALAAAVTVHGVPDPVFATAARVAEGQFALAPFAPAPVEIRAGFAEKREDGLDLHFALEEGGPEQRLLTDVLGIAPHQVRILAPVSAGRFGARDVDTSAILVGLAAWTLGRPVALLATSEAVAEPEPRLRVRARLAADRDGRLLAIGSETAIATGMPRGTRSSGFGAALVAGLAAQGAAGPYALGAARGSAQAFADGAAPIPLSRGLGAVETTIWREALIDDLAAGLGLDRLDIRRRNVPPSPAGEGLAACLDALAPHWRQALDEAEAFDTRPPGNKTSEPGAHKPLRGLGLGVAGGTLDLGTAPSDAVVRIVLESAGHLRLFSNCEETGQGISTALVQVAADALGVAMTDFTFTTEGEPAIVGPRARGAAACEAAAKAASALRHKLLDLVQAGLRAKLELSGGMLRVIEGGVRREVALTDLPTDSSGVVAAAEARHAAAPAPTFAAHLVLVEVNPVQGTVRPLRVVAAHDLGCVIHPGQAAGQIEGAVAQALGYAVMAAVGAKAGAAGPSSPIPRLGQVPAIEIVAPLHSPLDASAPFAGGDGTGMPPGPVGAKIIGPWAAAASAAAIFGAIRHATGIPLGELPASPAELRAALASGRAEKQAR